MIKLQRTTSDNADFRSLIKELDKDLSGRYKDQQAVYDQHNIIESNRNVIVAYKDSEAVGAAVLKNLVKAQWR
jgi:putative acetyltransferase